MPPSRRRKSLKADAVEEINPKPSSRCRRADPQYLFRAKTNKKTAYLIKLALRKPLLYGKLIKALFKIFSKKKKPLLFYYHKMIFARNY